MGVTTEHITMNSGIDRHPQTIEFEAARSAWSALLERFRNDGLLLISQVPNDENFSLLALARRFGPLIPSGIVGSGFRLENGYVYRVESDVERQEVDFDGQHITSQTSHYFACHTDGYRSKLPASVVLLMCVRRSRLGGETLVSPLDHILAGLAPEEVKLLRKPRYPSKAGFGPILYGSAERPSVRFNYLEIERYCQLNGYEMPAALKEVLNKFRGATVEVRARFRFLLNPGECLILDNRRVLHGRTEFAPHSDRLLKRVWVRSHSECAWESAKD